MSEIFEIAQQSLVLCRFDQASFVRDFDDSALRLKFQYKDILQGLADSDLGQGRFSSFERPITEMIKLQPSDET